MHVRPLTHKLAGNIWFDQEATWTSPILMTGKNAAVWAAFGALTAGAILIDRRTAHVFENSAGQVRWGNNTSHGGATYIVLPEVAGFYLWGVTADNQKARETGVLGGEALLDSLTVVEMLKSCGCQEPPKCTGLAWRLFQRRCELPVRAFHLRRGLWLR